MPFPFRLGTTSHIYEDTDLVGNVRRLGPLVDDVELVLYDTADYGSNIPDAAAVADLVRLAAEYHLTYTIHLPEDLWPENDSLAKAARVIDATRALRPFAYIAHLDGRSLPPHPALADTSDWRRKSGAALDAVIAIAGQPELVCVENVETWDPYLFGDIVCERGARFCVDVGHLWLEDAFVDAYLCSHLPHATVIHLHGVGARDHQSLALMPLDDIRYICEALSFPDSERVVTLEVFSEDDLLESLQVMQRCKRACKP